MNYAASKMLIWILLCIPFVIVGIGLTISLRKEVQKIIKTRKAEIIKERAEQIRRGRY